MSKPTKKQIVLDALANGWVNRFQAYHKLADSCLNSTISELRADGNIIADEWVVVRNRFGGETRVKRYKLIQRA